MIHLGDKDQLASVEAGAILGDICGKGRIRHYSDIYCRMYKDITGETIEKHSPEDKVPAIADCIVELHRSYRFGSGSGIGVASQFVNRGEIDDALTAIKDTRFTDIEWRPLPRTDVLAMEMKNIVIQGYRDYLQTDDPSRALELFDQFRVLCALREGPYGVIAINRAIEQALISERFIKPDSQWYVGRPVMVTVNDYNLKLYNGDIGIILPDSDFNNEPRAFFRDTDDRLRRIPPVRLPRHETVYAMTVHKSQGSEFDKALIILPDKDSPVLTRELIYTAITRAKEKAVLWGAENVFREAVSRQIERTSGLSDTWY